jgi:uncharacterized protein YdbL (DUF1318 family)
MTQPNGNPNDLNIQDLAVLRGVIELATERGTFKAQELAAVGTVYNKLDGFLQEVQKQAEAAKEGQEAAAAAAPEQTEVAEATTEE